MFIRKELLQDIETALYLGKTNASINGDKIDHEKISSAYYKLRLQITKQNIFIRLGKAIWFSLIDVDGRWKNRNNK